MTTDKGTDGQTETQVHVLSCPFAAKNDVLPLIKYIFFLMSFMNLVSPWSQTVMNVGIIIVMNVSCMSHNCHCSTRDTRQHRDMSVTPEHGAIMHLTNMIRQNKTLSSIDIILSICFYFS